jgi:hypothetical protein
MHACIILHNMVINDECDDSFDENYHIFTSVVRSVINYNASSSLKNHLQKEAKMTSGLMFSQLQLELIEHVWNKHNLRLTYSLIMLYFLFLNIK